MIFKNDDTATGIITLMCSGCHFFTKDGFTDGFMDSRHKPSTYLRFKRLNGSRKRLQIQSHNSNRSSFRWAWDNKSFSFFHTILLLSKFQWIFNPVGEGQCKFIYFSPKWCILSRLFQVYWKNVYSQFSRKLFD